jgi:hypothetical protein
MNKLVFRYKKLGEEKEKLEVFKKDITKPSVGEDEVAQKLYASNCDDALFSGVYTQLNLIANPPHLMMHNN